MELLIDLAGRVGGSRTDWQPGDVVVACPDGWPWSETERKNPKWMILKCPEMGKEEADSRASPELPRDLSGDKSKLQRCGTTLDVAALKAIEGEKETYPLAAVRVAFILKEPLQDAVKL